MSRPLPVARLAPATVPRASVLAFLDAVPAALLLLVPNSLMAVAGNAEAAALLGCAADALPAAWGNVMAAAPGGQALARWLRDLPQAGGEAFETSVDLPGGRGRDISVRARVALIEGQAWLAVTLEDITRRKQAEREAGRRLAELEALYCATQLGLAHLDRDLRFVRANEAMAGMTGMTAEAHAGCSLSEVMPGMQPALEPLLRRALEKREPIRSVKLRGAPAGAPGAIRDWVAHCVPVLDPQTGEVSCLGIACREITGQRRAELAQALLLRELDHRVKNLFAVIAGLVTFTARGVQTPEEMRVTLLGRIDALARAHDLVKLAIGGFAGAVTAPHHTSMRALAEALLSPFRTAAAPQRLRIEGEDVGVNAVSAAPLALVLHELATNAARHGALAWPRGCLTLRWAREEAQLRLAWDEQLGQAAAAAAAQPRRPGIGQRLVTQSALQLGGKASFTWRPEGLLVELMLPLARLGG